MKKLFIPLLVIVFVTIGYFYLNSKPQENTVLNDCINLIVPKFDEKQITIDEYTTDSVNLCVGNDYLIDYSNVSALKYDVKRFKIQYSPNSNTNIIVTSEEEWISGKPTGNFVESQAKVFFEGKNECFNAISPILMDVMVDYCFYEVSPNTFELKIEYESTFPI